MKIKTTLQHPDTWEDKVALILWESLSKEIQENTEWLSTTEGDEVECIGIENLEAILKKHLNKKINLKQI